MRVFVAFLAVAAAFTPSITSAQGLKSLSDVLEGSYERTYPYVRCAGFYLANVEWGGDAIAEPTLVRAKTTVESLVLVAAIARSEGNNDDAAHTADITQRDTRTIADLYLENYRTNYAETGAAWETNQLWLSDANVCKPIADAAVELSKDLGRSP